MSELDPLDEVLILFADDVIEAAQQELGLTRRVRGKSRRTNSTGELSRNLIYQNTKRRGNVKIDFTTRPSVAAYAGIVHEGRRPGSRQPPVEAILKWMREKPIRLRTRQGGFAKSTPEGLRGAAFAIARSIGRRGTVANPYYTTAINRMLEKYGPKFLEALEKQVELRLKFFNTEIK